MTSQQLLEDNRDYEETESEYAVELRKQAYLQGMGKELGLPLLFLVTTG